MTLPKRPTQGGLPRALSQFWSEEDGVTTVDWVTLAGVATAIAVATLNLGKEALGGYSSTVRNEVQTPYFNTEWTANVEIPPVEEWDDRPPIVPNFEDEYVPDEEDEDPFAPAPIGDGG